MTTKSKGLTRYNKITLIGLVLPGLILSGCANSGSSIANQADRSLIVVPVKGQPITVASMHTATYLAAGLVGAMVERSATAGASTSLSDRLNSDTQFKGERILAEECAALLRTSSKARFRDVTIHPLDVAIPGAKQMESSEHKRFKSNTSIPNTYQWRGIISEWLDGPPVAAIRPDSGNRPLFLEVTFSEMMLKNNDTITAEKGACVRLVDSITGKVIGSAKTGMIASFGITEVTASSSPRTFESDFRKGINKFARQMLADLGLL